MATDDALTPRETIEADALPAREQVGAQPGRPQPTEAPKSFQAVAKLNPDLEPFIFFGF